MRNSHFINVPYMPKWDPGLKFKAYDVSAPTNMIFLASAASTTTDTNPFDTWFSMRFTQDSKTNSISSTREALSNSFQRFGSYLALTLRFVGYVLGAYQRFTLDNSMTKKLYNYVDESAEQGPYDPIVPSDSDKFKKEIMNEAKEKRKPFKYSTGRFFCMKNFSSPWCCCCRLSHNDEDRL